MRFLSALLKTIPWFCRRCLSGLFDVVLAPFVFVWAMWEYFKDKREIQREHAPIDPIESGTTLNLIGPTAKVSKRRQKSLLERWKDFKYERFRVRLRKSVDEASHANWTDENWRRHIDLDDPYGIYDEDDPRLYGIYDAGYSGWRRGPLYQIETGERVSPIKLRQRRTKYADHVPWEPPPDQCPLVEHFKNPSVPTPAPVPIALPDPDRDKSLDPSRGIEKFEGWLYTDPERAAREAAEAKYTQADYVHWTEDMWRHYEDLGDPNAEYAEDDPRRYGFYGCGIYGWTFGPLYERSSGRAVGIWYAMLQTKEYCQGPLLTVENLEYENLAWRGYEEGQIPFGSVGGDYCLDPERFRREGYTPVWQ